MRLAKLRYILMAASLAFVFGLTGVWIAMPTSARSVTLPPGTVLGVRLDQTLASNQNRPGEEFGATMIEAVRMKGKIVIPGGTRVQGKVVNATQRGRLEGIPRLRVTLDSIKVHGLLYELHTDDVVRYGEGRRGQDTESIGEEVGGGALDGGLAGGERQNVYVSMPAEATLKFRLIAPLVVPGA